MRVTAEFQRKGSEPGPITEDELDRLAARYVQALLRRGFHDCDIVVPPQVAAHDKPSAIGMDSSPRHYRR